MRAWLGYGGAKRRASAAKDDDPLSMTIAEMDAVHPASRQVQSSRSTHALHKLQPIKTNRSFKAQMLALTFGTGTGQYSLLAFGALVLVILGAIFWVAFADGVESYDRSWRAAMWLSWGIFFDPGTHTGLSYDDGEVDKFIVVIFSVFGFLFNLVFLGVIVDNIRKVLDRFYTRYAEIQATDHVVILGWTPRTLFLINEVIALFEDQGTDGEIVVVGNRVRYDMERAVELAFRKRQPPVPKNVRVRCWEGDTAEEDDLTRLSLSDARFVVALSESNDPRLADAQAIEMILALQSLEDEDKCRGPIIAELRTKDALDVVRTVNETSTTDVLAVNSSRLVDMIVSMTMLRPTLGRALVQLTSFFGNNFMFVPVTPAQEGLTFVEASAQYPRAIVMGLRPNGGIPVIAPGQSTVLKKGDRLLCVAENRSDVLLADALAAAASTTAAASRSGAVPMAPVSSPPRLSNAQRSASSARLAQATVADKSIADLTPKAQKVVVIGWRTAREMAALVRSMSQLLAPGSEIFIVSQMEAEPREKALEAERHGMPDGTDFAHVTHVMGSPMSTAVLGRLPLHAAAVALVIADSAGSSAVTDGDYQDGDARLDDARVYAVTTLLRACAGPGLRIVTSFSHIMTYRLLIRGSSGRVGDNDTTKIVHRNALEVGLIAMQASDPTLSLVYRELLGADAVANRVVFVMKFDEARRTLRLTGSSYSFADMAERLLRTFGHVLFGHRTFDIATGEPELNPPHKDTPIEWRAQDELLLFRHRKASA